MKLCSTLFLFVITFGFSQKYSKQEMQLFSQTQKLDSLMQNNDIKILELLEKDISFGHSNGWVQNFNDFKKDFISKKVHYSKIEQLEILDVKKFKKTFRIRRKIRVSGWYKNNAFGMNLSLLEIWIKNKSDWKLLSRQSIEIKP